MAKSLKLEVVLSALDMASESLHGINKTLAVQSKALQKAKSHLKTLDDSYKGLQNTIMSLQSVSKTVSTSMISGGNAVQTQIQQTTALIQSQMAAMGKLNAQKRMQTKLNGVGGDMQSFGTKTALGGAKAGGWLSRLLAPGLSFEESMSKFQAKNGFDKNSEELKSYRQLARDNALSAGVDHNQVLQGIDHLVNSKFSYTDTKGAMPAVINMALAGNVDIARAADISSNILSAFNKKVVEMPKVADVLVATSTHTNTDLNTLRNTMLYMADEANRLNVGLEGSAAIAGILNNVGIQGTQAGAAGRATLTGLAGGGENGDKALKEIGVKTTDAKGNLRPVLDIFDDIIKKTANMGNAERMTALESIVGEEAGAAFAKIIDSGNLKQITDLIAKLKNDSTGAASRVAAIMSDNALGDIKKLGSAWTEFSIVLNESEDLPLRKIIKSITETIRQVGIFAKENPELTAKLVKFGAIGIASSVGLGILSFALGTLIRSIMFFSLVLRGLWAIFGGVKMLVGGAISVFMKLGEVVIPMLGKSMLWLGRVFMMNPITLVISLIVGAIYLLYQNWEKVVAFMTNNPLAQAFTELPVIKELIDFISLGIETVANLLTGNWAAAWESAKNTSKAALDFITAPIQALLSLVDNLIGKISTAFGELGKLTGSDWADIGKTAFTPGSGATWWDFIKDTGKSLVGMPTSIDEKTAELNKPYPVKPITTNQNKQVTQNFTINVDAKNKDEGKAVVFRINEALSGNSSALLGDYR